MRQNARIKQVLRDQHGDRPTVGGVAYPAFPRPERVLDLESLPGVAAHKLSWLHALARAALDGRLDTDALPAHGVFGSAGAPENDPRSWAVDGRGHSVAWRRDRGRAS